MGNFDLERLGEVMVPQAGSSYEVDGVLNPGAARGPDGQLYLFPRLVARGNYSRIGIVRVNFDRAGKPTGVERLGIALEPEADYELRPGGGGCEDPRITYVEPMQCYVMTYAALSLVGPRIAFAISKDLFNWKRLGLAKFESYRGIDFVHVDNKDASLFPLALPNHAGKMQLALLHRPLFAGTRPEEMACHKGRRDVDPDHESIWISYSPIPPEGAGCEDLGLFNSHHRLASPVNAWARLKVGAGTPPVLTRLGWLVIYHGVCQIPGPSNSPARLCYSAGVMLLSKDKPQHIRYRSADPILTPTLPQERSGTVANVVFPTGIDRRDDLGLPDRFDIYYGMADSCIGVAELNLPHDLSSAGAAAQARGSI
jgi:predicted GH43/DUF377 family glycosyl hydrolase